MASADETVYFSRRETDTLPREREAYKRLGEMAGSFIGEGAWGLGVRRQVLQQRVHASLSQGCLSRHGHFIFRNCLLPEPHQNTRAMGLS